MGTTLGERNDMSSASNLHGVAGRRKTSQGSDRRRRATLPWPVIAVLTLAAMGASVGNGRAGGVDQAVEALNEALGKGNVEIVARSVIVTVHAEGSGPLPGARVVLESTPCSFQAPEGFAGIDGKVRFDDVAPGLWRVVTRLPGYAASATWIVVIGTTRGAPPVQHRVILREPAQGYGVEPAGNPLGNPAKR